MDTEFQKELCDRIHFDLDRRIGSLESLVKENLCHIHEKLDKFGQRPSWFVLITITTLSSGFMALLVVLLNRKG